MLVLRCLGLCASFLFFSFLLTDDASTFHHEQTIVFDFLHDVSFKPLKQLFSDAVLVESITYESDVYFESDEFFYLVGITKNNLVTQTDLKKALGYLKLKNKFSSLRLTISQTQNGVGLHFDLEGFWTFNRVKFHGPVLGKDKYRQYYMFEPTETFDIKKHTDSVKKIQATFLDNGYFDAQVFDALDYDKKNKGIIVNIVLEPGTRYLLNKLSLQVNDNKGVLSGEAELFTKKVIKKFGAQLHGSLFSQKELDAHVCRLGEYLGKKGFFHVSYDIRRQHNSEQKMVVVVVEVTLNDRKKYTFFGNRFFSKKLLLEQFGAFSDSMVMLPPSMLKDELLQLYRKKGFWSATVEVKQQENEYFFLINEGQRVCVSDVVLCGVKSFPVATLRKQFFGQLKRRNHFDAESVKQSLKQLMAFYVQEGFWDVKVLQQEYVASDDKNDFRLIVTVDEGLRRQLVSCTIDAFPELMSKEPFVSVCKRLPMPFNVDVLRQQRQALVQHFEKEGYLYAEIVPKIEQEDSKVSLTWCVDLKDTKVTFGKTVITGCGTFPFKHLMHRLQCKPGSLWEKQKIDESLANLRDLKGFEAMYMYPHNVALPELEKPILVKLIQDDPFEARLRVGFQQVGKNLTFRKGTTYRLGGSFLYKNPMNLGDHFYCTADANRFYRYVSGTYVIPWNLYSPANIIAKGYTNKYTQPVKIGSDKTLYNARQQGFLFGVTRKYKIAELGLNVGLELMETRNLSSKLAEAINFEPRLVDKNVPYIVFEPGFLADRLDNKLNPTRGFLTALSAKGMFSWDRRAVTFFKVLAEQSVFVPLGPLVFGARVRLGHIFNQTLRAIMPPERFYLGGAFSLRGYEPDLAPPLGLFVEEDGKERLVPQGGKSMFNCNFELRFWLYKNFGGTIFQDFGILSDTRFSDVRPHGLLAATGFGLRYETPIGPLRFDLGFKWKRRDLEKSAFAWFLTFGNAF